MRTDMRAKRLLTLLVAFGGVLSLLMTSTYALGTEYDDLDVVVVMDTSGSMRMSDPKRVSVAAIKMLVNMMPAENSRVGIVAFNTEATVLTQDASGNPSLSDLAEIADVKYVKSQADSVVFTGDTGIGTALKAATDLLSKKSDSNHKRAIILFTDGVVDLPTKEMLMACESDEAEALNWTSNNDCPIYCIGFNYITSSGISSMGANGEGIAKLKSYSDTTGGYTKATSNIYEIERVFIDMLANICSLYYLDVATVSGDGGKHDVVVTVTPNVIEANIRISCDTTDAIKRGTIELFTPTGKKIDLSNHDNIRYDVDATAASIKVLSPENGKWILSLSGIKGEDVKIGLLEHYDLDIKSKLKLPIDKTEQTLYTGDTVEVVTQLCEAGSVISSEDIYDFVTSAKIRLIADGEVKMIEMRREGASFVGELSVNRAGTYDITVEVDSDSFHRENELSVTFQTPPNQPVTLVKNFEDMEVKRGEQKTIDELLMYAEDADGDVFLIDSVKLLDDTIAVASYDEQKDSLAIDGKKMGKTDAVIRYRDSFGNETEASFTITVNDPLLRMIRWIVAFLALVLIVIIIILFRKKERKIKGKLEIEHIDVSDDVKISLSPKRDEYGEIDSRYEISLPMRTNCLQWILDSLTDSIEGGTLPAEKKLYSYLTGKTDGSIDAISREATRVKVVGTYKGKDGIVLILPKTSERLVVCGKSSGEVKVRNGQTITIDYMISKDDEPAFHIEAVFKNGFGKYKTAVSGDSDYDYVPKNAKKKKTVGQTSSQISRVNSFDID